MTTARAVLKLGNRVVLENLSASITQQTSRSGLKSWHGSFMAPSGIDLDAEGPFMLSLDDGRSGAILISNLSITPSATLVQFRGTGPLD
jgi:hypothetical protein